MNYKLSATKAKIKLAGRIWSIFLFTLSYSQSGEIYLKSKKTHHKKI